LTEMYLCHACSCHEIEDGNFQAELELEARWVSAAEDARAARAAAAEERAAAAAELGQATARVS
jgi:hypothetical protein